ncbi:hypothetical protein [Niabella sp.]|nr:hypothetical protein [Niabella sp.]
MTDSLQRGKCIRGSYDTGKFYTNPAVFYTNAAGGYTYKTRSAAL